MAWLDVSRQSVSLPAGFGYSTMTIKKRTGRENYEFRLQFPAEARHAFRQHVARQLRVRVAALDGLQIHHIEPVSLGGSNDWQNLVLVNPLLHERLHEFIDARLWRGATTVQIPRARGWVWR